MISAGTVKSAELCAPLDHVKITRKNAAGKIIASVESDINGHWNLKNLETDDSVIFEKKGYVSKLYNTDNSIQKSIIRLLEDEIIGYQDKLWFKPREKISVYVHASRVYTAKLFRHGLKKECILNLGEFPACPQTIPDGYFTENGLKWKATFSYAIPANARPGIYSLLLQANDQPDFAIPFVVSTPQPSNSQNKILVLASTNNWQCYNLWGGRSRYRNNETSITSEYYHVPNYLVTMIDRTISQYYPGFMEKVKKLIYKLQGKRYDKSWELKRLSIKRPFTNCNLEGGTPFRPFTNHLAAGEWRVLAWLEQENFNYDIITGNELHRKKEVLSNYKTIILSTHSEYWSKEMYQQLKTYHLNNKLWIINLSGNSIYRQVDYFEDGSLRCVSTSFSKTCEDETQLLGVRWTEWDYGTCAPYKISVPDHWIFNNIPVYEKSRVFGGLSLNQNTKKLNNRYDPGRPGVENGLAGMGASGWETDKLSRTAPKDIKVIAKGMNKRGGADMVFREPAGKRGGMFSASSVTFGGCLLVDSVASKLVKNVINQPMDH